MFIAIELHRNLIYTFCASATYLLCLTMNLDDNAFKKKREARMGKKYSQTSLNEWSANNERKKHNTKQNKTSTLNIDVQTICYRALKTIWWTNNEESVLCEVQLTVSNVLVAYANVHP